MASIARTMALAAGLFGGVVASQGPEYAQQYRQRLGGAADELRRVTQRFDADAAAVGQTREGAVDRLRQDPSDLVRRQGDAARANQERLDRLERQQRAFAEAGPFSRLLVLIREADPDIARAAYGAFEPAVPATGEGVAAGAAGFAAVWLGMLGVGRMLRLLIGRRRVPARRAA